MSEFHLSHEQLQALAIDFAYQPDSPFHDDSGAFIEMVMNNISYPNTEPAGEEFNRYLSTTTKGHLRPEVQKMAELLTAYAGISPITSGFANSEEIDCPGFEHLGSGSWSIGYGFTGPNGEDLVLRKPYTGNAVSIISNHVMVQAAISFPYQVLNTERMVAASLQDRVTVSQRVRGRQLGVAMIEGEVDPQHVVTLAEEIIELNSRGVWADPKATNYFYTPDGFVIIDMNYLGYSSTVTNLRGLADTLRAFMGKNADIQLVEAGRKILSERQASEADLLV